MAQIALLSPYKELAFWGFDKIRQGFCSKKVNLKTDNFILPFSI